MFGIFCFTIWGNIRQESHDLQRRFQFHCSFGRWLWYSRPARFYFCFPFRNFYWNDKLLIRSPNKVLAQVVRRISELENISELDRSIKKSVFNPENPVACVSTLKKNLKINSKKDSYYLCENGMAVKLVGLSDTCVSVRYFTRQRNLYTKPMKSKNIDIFKSDGLEAEVTILAINSLQLVAKCWVLPMSKGCCVIPLLHHSWSSGKMLLMLHSLLLLNVNFVILARCLIIFI